MDGRSEYLGMDAERRVIKPLQNRELRHLFMDNCSSSHMTEAVLQAAEEIRTTLRYFSANTNEMNEPCDSCVTEKLKDVWRLKMDD